jgi:hypothetical protein
MTQAEQKVVEERIEMLLDGLAVVEKAVLYKTLHAEGLRITACDTLIRQEPVPAYMERQQAVPALACRHSKQPMKYPVP